MRRVLMVKTHALGDVLMVTPAIRAFKKSFPDAVVDFLVGEHAFDILKNNPFIDNLIAIPEAYFFRYQIWKLIKLINKLRHSYYEVCIIFQSSKRVQRLFSFIRSKRFITFNRLLDFPESYRKLLPWRVNRNKYVVEDFLSLVQVLGAESDGVQLDYIIEEDVEKTAILQMNSFSIAPRNYIVLCPCGGRNQRDFVPQKIWPDERYAEIAARLEKLGWIMVVTGLESEKDMVPQLLKVKNVVNLMGKLSIDTLATYIRYAALVITNDSFPMHLALSLGTAFIPIFGPSRRNALLPETGKFYPVTANTSCAPCYDNEPFPGCRRFDCIRSVSVDSVWEQIRKVV